MSWIHKLNRKMGRWAIPHLMYIISAGMLGVFLANLLRPELGIGALIHLDMSLVVQGEIWRLITFIFAPPSSSPLFILLNLYFYCLIGDALEQEWGSFSFNFFYLCGMIATIIGALFTGIASSYYLNLSLFLAFAAVYPNFEIMLFFFLPIKVKYLALADAAYLIYLAIVGGWSVRIAILMSVVNLILFFGGDFIKNLKQQSQYWETRRNFRKYNR